MYVYIIPGTAYNGVVNIYPRYINLRYNQDNTQGKHYRGEERPIKFAKPRRQMGLDLL